MNAFAKFAAGFALVVFLPSLAVAHMEELKNSTPQERADLQTDWMKTNLSLDEKASAAAADINLKYAQENQTLLHSASPKFDRLMSFRKNVQAKDAELKTVLTPEQYSLYKQKEDDMEKKMKQKFIQKHQSAQ
jgi:hypothetical protein